MRAVCAILLTLLLALTGHVTPDPDSSRLPDRGTGDRSSSAGHDDGSVPSLAAPGGAVSALSAPARAGAPWDWPLPGRPRIVRHFEPPEERWLPGHRGVDLVGQTYSPVLAVADGTVTYSGSIAGVGIISVTHADGIRSTYQPVLDRIGQGEPVAAGDQLGVLGVWGSHCVFRSCLHLGAVRGEDDYLDPLLFLQSWELTLLPHAE